MAKSQRIAFPPLPLSSGFYAALHSLGKQLGLPVWDGPKLSAAVAALSHTYTHERELLSSGKLGEQAPLARLGFFLPRDAIKVFGPLGELTGAGYFEGTKRLRVLDLGAGLGATTLGVARYLRLHGHTTQALEVTAIERDVLSTKIMRGLVSTLAPLTSELVPIKLEVSAGDLTQVAAEGPFDLVLLGFVLNELFLDQPEAERPLLRARLLASLSDKLSPNGALIVLEPALKQSARELMRSRDALGAAPARPFVFAPCVRSGPCPMLAGERDWCHEVLDYALPAHLSEVARAAGLRYEGLSYAALVLTQRPRQLVAGDGELYRIVSDQRVSKGKLELFGCGEAGHQRLTRLDRHRSSDNRGFDELRRGDIVALAEPRVAADSHVRKL